MLITIKKLGLQPYVPIWQAMQQFTQARTPNTPDELWALEHEAVFTQGQAGKAEHILEAHEIPIIQTDRGGQVTYHGPEQLVIYCLLDILRLNLHTRQLVMTIEQAIIETLQDFGIVGNARRDAPGVYVANEKIASIGLRVTKGRCYHGLSINVNNDLTPFSYINPCGIKQQAITNFAKLGVKITLAQVQDKLIEKLLKNFF
jgi:lipoyl(octanoyl) transferase